MLTWKWHRVEPQVLGWVPIRQGSQERKKLVPERSSSGALPSLRDRKRSWNFHIPSSTSVSSTSVCLSLGFSWDSLLHLPKKNLRCFQNSFFSSQTQNDLWLDRKWLVFLWETRFLNPRIRRLVPCCYWLRCSSGLHFSLWKHRSPLSLLSFCSWALCRDICHCLWRVRKMEITLGSPILVVSAMGQDLPILLIGYDLDASRFCSGLRYWLSPRIDINKWENQYRQLK